MKLKKYPQFFSSRFSQAFFVFKHVVKIVWQVNRKYLLVMFIANVLIGVSSLPIFITEKNIIDFIVRNVGNPAWQETIRLFILLITLRVSLGFLQGVLRRILWHVENSLSRMFSARLEILMGQKMIQLDMATIETPKFKDRFNKIETESGRRAWALTRPLGNVVGEISGLLSAFSLLVVFRPVVALIIFVLSLPEFLVDAKFIKEQYEFIGWAAPKHRLWYLFSHHLIKARNFFEVKLLRASDYLTEKLMATQKEVLEAGIKLRKRRQAARIWSSLPLMIFILFFNAYLAILAILTRISVGSVEMYIRASYSFQNNLTGLMGSLLEFYENHLYVRDLIWFLNLKPKIEFGKRKIKDKLEKGLEVENLWFKYLKKGPWVIKGLDLVVRPGETIAIVGENGAGKTTLAKLLCRFYDLNKGKISLESISIKNLEKESLYKQYSILFQNFEGFPFSARESIGFGNIEKVADLKEIKKWAKKVDIHQFISSLPLKYETPLVRDFEKGTEPSTGQWQRIGLARTLMKQAPIVILDEPTSNVDPKAEEKIFAEIKKLAGKKRILIFISHRFSTVRRADKIYVMDKGKFIEQGSHQELMKLNGKYAKLFIAQAKYYQ